MRANNELARLLSAAVVAVMLLAWPGGQAFAAGEGQAGGTREEEVSVRNGDISLSGTLVLPAAGGPHPAVVVVHGSDPDVRGPLLGYAGEVFGQKGVAALVYDKRGAGKSSGVLATASLEDLASDAQAWVEYLKGRPDIDPRHIGMVGDSQAGWIIPMVASRTKDVAFMVLVSASAVSPGQQEVFHIESEVRAARLSERVADTGRKARKLLADYTVAVNKGQLPATEDFKQTDGINLGQYHDPVPALEQITQPALIILGGRDPNVPAYHCAAVFDRVLKSSGNIDYTIILYPDANHGIEAETKNAQGETVSNYVPTYRPNITNWVLAHVGKPAPPLQLPPAQNYTESNEFGGSGKYALPPWYGTAAGQFGLIGLFALVFLTAIIGLPIAGLVRLLTRRGRQAWDGREREAGVASVWAFVACVVNLVALAGTVVFVADLLSSGETISIDPIFNALPILGLVAVVFAVGLVVFAALSWRWGYWSAAGRVYYSILALAAVLFVAFLGYWNMLGFQL